MLSKIELERTVARRGFLEAATFFFPHSDHDSLASKKQQPTLRIQTFARLRGQNGRGFG